MDGRGWARKGAFDRLTDIYPDTFWTDRLVLVHMHIEFHENNYKMPKKPIVPEELDVLVICVPWKFFYRTFYTPKLRKVKELRRPIEDLMGFSVSAFILFLFFRGDIPPSTHEQNALLTCHLSRHEAPPPSMPSLRHTYPPPHTHRVSQTSPASLCLSPLPHAPYTRASTTLLHPRNHAYPMFKLPFLRHSPAPSTPPPMVPRRRHRPAVTFPHVRSGTLSIT